MLVSNKTPLQEEWCRYRHLTSWKERKAEIPRKNGRRFSNYSSLVSLHNDNLAWYCSNFSLLIRLNVSCGHLLFSFWSYTITILSNTNESIYLHHYITSVREANKFMYLLTMNFTKNQTVGIEASFDENSRFRTTIQGRSCVTIGPWTSLSAKAPRANRLIA